ncbi:MAG: SIMPL domain-containing protein, partial [Alteraurantiacibacter sp.]
ANSAYANAYEAARTRAEAYAEAAGMEIARVLYIRDAGGSQGNRYFAGAQATAADAMIRTAPPPPVSPPPPISMGPTPEEQAGGYGATIMPGQTTSSVTVQVDFALVEK